MLDMKALAQATAEIVKDHVAAATGPLIKRIEELEGRESPAPIKGIDGSDGLAGRDGLDGKDCDMEAVMARVEEYLATVPMPENGKDGRDGQDGVKGEPGRDGQNGRDGADVVDALIDRDGGLVLTLSDGRVKSLGAVVGRDGRDGTDGQHGAAGANFTDFETEWRPDEKVLILSLEDGDTKTSHELFFPYVRDAGVWVEGKEYLKGDCVTWAGSLWTAQDDTTDKPDTGKGWRLAVKRGRDGKPAGVA